MAADIFVLPSSFAQDRLWLVQQLAPTSPAYHIAGGLRLTGQLDVDLLFRCVQTVVDRHEALRTTFGLGPAGTLVQLVHDAMPAEVGFRDLSVDSQALDSRSADSQSVDQQVALRARSFAAVPFDLASGPLLRVEILRAGTDDHRLIFVAHHIMSDGWSLGLFMRELGELYRAGITGEAARLPELEVQYADWAVWQRDLVTGDLAGTSLDYWRKRLDGAHALELPTSRVRQPLPRLRGGEVPLSIDPDLCSRLHALAQQQRATPFMALTAALALGWSRLSGQDDLVIGTPVAGRTVREAEPLIGCFVNTLPLRIDLSGAPTFRELVARSRETCLGAYAHQDVPFERLAELAGPTRRAGSTPLVTTMLAMRDLPAPVWPGVDLAIEPFGVPTGGAQVDLAVYLGPTADGGMAGEVVFDRDLFDLDEVSAMCEVLTTTLAEAVAAPDVPIRRLAVMSAATRARLMGYSGVNVPAVADGLLHAGFEAVAGMSPDAVAVLDGDHAMTYAELDRKANQLAHFLQRYGVGRGELVGVMLPRSAPMAVALLGVLKAGAAYLPLDTGYPAERLRFMVSDSGARIVLTDAATAEVGPLAGGDVQLIRLDAEDAGISREPTEPPSRTISPADLAYVIYTSGSTGRPKGAMNEHRALANRISWMQQEYGLRPGESVLHKTPLSFDVSGWEVHWPLAVGARMVLARPDGHRDPEYLADLIRTREISTVHFVPSMLRAFLSAGEIGSCVSLRRIICSGEELPRDLAEQCMRALPGVEIHNLYGPTEAAIDVTAARVEVGPESRVTIGRPIAGARAYLLDVHGELGPPGASGELYLGGIAVGRGYHRRPALTAEKFVPDPFEPGARLYRTGDLARWRSDGTLDFLGRIDAQVKIRGQRIETGEVEAVLSEHPQVENAAVVAITDAPDGAYLAAFVTAKLPPPSSHELRGYLRSRLPEAMVPALITLVDALPLTPSGKLDRTRLPSVARPERIRSAAPPSGWAEETIAAIWAEVLGLSDIGADENFYDLGGNSLRAVTVLTRAREHGLSVSMSLLLGEHTVRELASSATTLDAANLDAVTMDAANLDAGNLGAADAIDEATLVPPLRLSTF